MKKILILGIILIGLTGCENKECIKSHQESSTCVQAIYVGGRVQTIVVPCVETICDEYQEE